MKSDSINLEESVLTSASQPVQNNPQKSIIRCQGKNISIQNCVNQDCSNNAFICNEQQCSCNQKHQNCYTLSLKKLLKVINSKRISVEFLQQFIDNKIQSIIDYLSNFQEQTKKWIKQELQFLGLNQNQKQLLNSIAKGETSSITGNKIWQILHPQRKQIPLNQFITENINILQNHFKDIQGSLNLNLQKITSEMKFYEQKIFDVQNPIITYLVRVQHKSKIITSNREAQRMRRFFNKKKIQSAKLLYRASQNNFETKKFHQNCDDLTDTLVLIETEFNKKIGGYTPLGWGSSGTSNNQKCVNDESMTSFLFSLTENDKFNLVNQSAIYHNSSHGPLFGSGYDIAIYDKANTNNSHSNINNSYQNSKYTKGDKNSRQRFHGNPQNSSFKTKQWEVWGLEFA